MTKSRCMLVRLTGFLGDTRAAVGVASALITLMCFSGIALVSDHLVLLHQRRLLEAASASASIAATQRLAELATGLTQAEIAEELEPVARRYVLANLPEGKRESASSTLELEITPDHDNGVVGIEVSADLGGALVGRYLWGRVAEKTSVSAGTKSVVSPVDLVLAIDVSASMTYDLRGRWHNDNRRIDLVKESAKDLVSILDLEGNDEIEVALVPWSMTVRLDSDARTEWTDEGWAEYPASRHYQATYFCHPLETCASASDTQTLPAFTDTWHGCLDEHRVISATGKLPDTADLLEAPSNTPFAQAIFPAPYGTAYQCLAAKPGNYRSQYCYDSSAASETYRTIVDAQYGCGNDYSTLLPLTADADTVNDAIDALNPIGVRTYSALGVLWGHRLLSSSWDDVWGREADGQERRKAIVLLTDGEDNICSYKDRECDNGVGIDRADACRLAKADGIEIFVIAAMAPKLVSSSLEDSLRACSSEGDDPDGTYVFVNNATSENLAAAFADIGKQLVTVRRLY